MDIKEIKEKLAMKHYKANKEVLEHSMGDFEWSWGIAQRRAYHYAMDLIDKLDDEPIKPVIPQFVADWIEEYRNEDFAVLGIAQQILDRVVENHIQNEWRINDGNQKLLLNAIANGYTVENEKKYAFYLPSIRMWLWDWEGEVELTPTECALNNMTVERAKEWKYFDNYNEAGLFEITEVTE